MKITVESTEKIVTLNGVPTRVWEGISERGVKIHCFIARVAVAEGRPSKEYEQFERDLKEQAKASAEVEAIPMRLIL